MLGVQKRIIGFAQNRIIKYTGNTNPIHLEVKYQGQKIDHFEQWQYSFFIY